MTSCGAAGELLSLLCQPAELQDAVAVPPELEFLALDSGVRHSVSGSDYTSVRVAAFMGARLLREEAGLEGGGYLANVQPSEFETAARGTLPESMGGCDFIERYGQTADTWSSLNRGATMQFVRPPLIQSTSISGCKHSQACWPVL